LESLKAANLAISDKKDGEILLFFAENRRFLVLYPLEIMKVMAKVSERTGHSEVRLSWLEITNYG
jgi:hypothetical protein